MLPGRRLLAWFLTPPSDLEAQMSIIAAQPDEDAREQHKAELREAITHMAKTASRMPAHWVDRKKAIHDQINEKLYELEGLG